MELHRFEDSSKYGYRDENETIIIPTKYEDAKEFKDNLAIVKYNGFFGVINSSDETVIDFIYSSIEENLNFFECFKIQINDPKEKTFWYNRCGVLLHEGKAFTLSEKFLCISNGKKYGVINQNGNRIINCLYDEIVQKNELFIVLRDDKLGLYDLSGNIILDAFCNSIESVDIDNDPLSLGSTTFSEKCGTFYYPGYCKEYYFDPNGCRHFNNGSINDLLFRRIITVRGHKVANILNSNPTYEIYCWRPINDITKPMIISTGANKMIFIKSEGILPNSEFDDIQQITQICYVVKNENLFGVYRVDTKDLVIPIEYESIQFFGGHTVLVCKDGLWGARSLGLDSNIFNIFFKVEIPNDYLEICILDDFQHYFGCKKKKSYSTNSHFTIVQSNGEEIYDISELECDSQFVYIDDSHFITSIDRKFGFINPQGHKVIPFKYDEITIREDGRFNVRINNRWGLLSLDGREIVPLKYSSPVSSPFDKEILVKDAESDCFGLVNPDGAELIPSIYEHLLSSEDKDLYYFGYGGYVDEDHPNFFSGDINGAKWGVISSNGKIIIDAKYRNFKLQSGFIVAGRDGHYFPDDDNDDSNWFGSNFDGVYDLYNKDGELLIGGFREFEYEEKNEIFIFFFGGEWKEYTVYDDDWNNIHITGYRFEKGKDLWLILDKDFKTILRDKDGNPKHFKKGFLGKIDIKQEDNKIKHVYNMPINLMAKGFSHVAINSIIINNSNSEYHQSQAVDIKTGKTTKFYTKIEQITESLFFFAEDSKVGITNIEEELITNCLFLTYPINGFYFIAKEIDDEYSNLELRSMNDENIQIEAINKMETSKLIDLALYGRLKIEFDSDESSLENIIIPMHNIFSESLISKISTKESNYFCSKFKEIYWFTDDYRMEEDDSSSDYDDYDHDYEKDSWYAMTDGMYGDMPDGFDGDYSFLGR